MLKCDICGEEIPDDDDSLSWCSFAVNAEKLTNHEIHAYVLHKKCMNKPQHYDKFHHYWELNWLKESPIVAISCVINDIYTDGDRWDKESIEKFLHVIHHFIGGYKSFLVIDGNEVYFE